MKAPGRGRIVNISSVRGWRRPAPPCRCGVEGGGYTPDALQAVALAPRRSVNCVAPGLLPGQRATPISA